MLIINKNLNISKLSLIYLLAASILLLIASTADAKDITINCAGVDDLPTIEAAVNDTSINKIKLVGTCHLKTRLIPARGSYSSEIAIRRSNLYLDGGGTASITTEGPGEQTVFFVKPGTATPDPNDPLADGGEIPTSNVLISGITFLNGSGVRDHATGASSNGARVKATFANNVYDGQLFVDAAFMFGNTEVVIKDNLFKNQGTFGILLESGIFNENIGDAIVKGNTFMDIANSAVLVLGKSKLIMTDNEFIRTGHADSAAVVAAGGGNVNISKNRFSETNDNAPDIVLTGMSESFTPPEVRKDYCDYSGNRVIDNKHSSNPINVLLDSSLNPNPVRLIVFNCGDLDPPVAITSSGNIVVVGEGAVVQDWGDNIVVQHQ